MDKSLLKHKIYLTQILVIDWPIEAKNAVRDALTWDQQDLSKLPAILRYDSDECISIRQALRLANPLERSVFNKWKRVSYLNADTLVNAETVVFTDNNLWGDDFITLLRYIATSYGLDRKRQAKILFAGLDSDIDRLPEGTISAWGWGAVIWKDHQHPLEGVFQHCEDPSNTCSDVLQSFVIDTIIEVIQSGDMTRLVSAGRCLRAMWYSDLYYAESTCKKITETILNRLSTGECNESERALLTYLCNDLNIEVDIMVDESLF